MKKSMIGALTAMLSLMAATAGAEVNVHDPSVIKADGTYYIFGTHITAAKSADLISWSEFTNGYTPVDNALFGDLSANLAGSFAWAGENDMDCAGGFAVWAPDVFYNADYINEDGSRGAYLMYYSASSTYIRSCIGLAVSKNIEGPYTYADTIIYSGFTEEDAFDEGSEINKNYRNTNLGRLIDEGVIIGYSENWGTGTAYNNSYAPNCIDPCIYEDADGGLWMVYGSWSGGIFTLRLDRETGRAVYPGRDYVTAGGNPVDRYFGVRLAGGKGWSGEGPFIYYDKEAGWFYLQDTYEWLGEDGGYHIRLFRSKNPDGPFVDTMGRNALYGRSLDYQGLKLFGNYRFDEMNPAYKSGGHSSALIDEDGKQYIFYHTRFSDRGGYFESRVHRMFVNEDGWPVVAPYRYLGNDEDKAGFSKEEIAGVYQYINHGSEVGLGETYMNASALYLNADGSVRGAATGGWISDGKNITLDLRDGVYKGVLYRQKNENGVPVLTFAAAGNNNCSVWGVKNGG
ncbi:MAG: glycoside hydrolase family 43 protein [Oscillospiraceae bacterium]|nr:glycoside hydrolase family 43 protein [Oscillospiraceae bacterium]